MSTFEALPPDQKAVLQLLLRQGKSYTDLAALLKLDAAAVRERALDALVALGPDAPAGLSPERQDDICDYLLGQQTASERAVVRDYLGESASGRAWARIVAGELRPIAPDALPEIPAEGAEVAEAFDALEARQVARAERERSSKLGGLLLLGGLGIIVAVILIIALGGGDDDNGSPSVATTTTSTQGATGATGPKVEAQINLQPTAQGSQALGVANVVSQDNQRAIAVVGQGLPKNPRYAVWLYSSPSKFELLGFVPGGVKSNGRLQGLAPVPDDIAQYTSIIVTRESVDRPKRPGPIALRGSLRG